MRGNRKEFKKPSFLKTYAVCLAVTAAFVLCIGILLYLNVKIRYDNDISRLSEIYREEFVNSLYSYHLDKKKLSVQDRIDIKEYLVDYYVNYGIISKVYFEDQTVADSSKTAIVWHSDTAGMTYHLEIADTKYLERFNDPDVVQYATKQDNRVIPFEDGMSTEIKLPSHLELQCKQFYVDQARHLFIPAVCMIKETGTEIITESGYTGGYRFVNASDKDITLIISGDNGAGSEIDESPHSNVINYGFANRYGKRCTIVASAPAFLSFEEMYNKEIRLFFLVLAAAVLVIALIPAFILYERNRTNYKIYEYRRKTIDAMAHDLKTPLAAIAAYADNLENNIGTDKQEHYSKKIHEKVDQMSVMINNILSFSKSEDVTCAINKSDVDIGTLISRIITEYEQTIYGKKLKITVSSGTQMHLKTDEDLFYQALGNLIGNAVLYSPDSSEIKITSDDDSIIIQNEITGKIENIEHLEEPFVKGDSSRHNSGTGLGLAIADNDLALLGYTLEIRIDGNHFIAVISINPS